MCCDTMETCQKGAWSGIGTGSWIGTGHGLVLEISSYLFKSVIFPKATKAAGQLRLSKFEAIECSEIGHSWPYQLTLPALYQLTLHRRGNANMDVLSKLMDYMPSKFNTLKANIAAYI